MCALLQAFLRMCARQPHRVYQTHVNLSDIHVTHTGASVCSNADFHLRVKPWNVCSTVEIPPGRTGGCALWYRSWEIRYNAWILLCCMVIDSILISLSPGSCWYRFCVLQMWIEKFYLNLSPPPHKWESGTLSLHIVRYKKNPTHMFISKGLV